MHDPDVNGLHGAGADGMFLGPTELDLMVKGFGGMIHCMRSYEHESIAQRWGTSTLATDSHEATVMLHWQTMHQLHGDHDHKSV